MFWPCVFLPKLISIVKIVSFFIQRVGGGGGFWRGIKPFIQKRFSLGEKI